MNNKLYIIDRINIIGTTLWSYIPTNCSNYISKVINYYYIIKNYEIGNLILITTDDTNAWNKESINFIENEINKCHLSCIILTHHAPLFSNEEKNQYTADPKYLNGNNNYAFHNNLEYLLKFPINVWLYGHTHYTNKFKINNIIVTSNQLGYASEERNIKFSTYAYIDLWNIILDNL